MPFQIVRELKEQIEEQLDTELIYAAGAIPPGTDLLDSGAVRNVIQGASFECTNLLDESTAANQVLQMKNGAVVDIGGGTTGISILKDGEVVYIADEPTEAALIFTGDRRSLREIFPGSGSFQERRIQS